MKRIKDDHRKASARGFTLVEILIVVVILGILGALVVPRFSNASEVTRQNKMREDLRYLRMQVMVYATEHRDRAPGVSADGAEATGELLEAHLTGFSNEQGATAAVKDAEFKFGPYMLRMPQNPFNQLSSVRVIGPGAFPADAEGTAGWIYQPSTLRVASDALGEDERGVKYIEY